MYYCSYRMANSEESCHRTAESGRRLVEIYAIFTWWAEARGSWPHWWGRPRLGSGDSSGLLSFRKWPGGFGSRFFFFHWRCICFDIQISCPGSSLCFKKKCFSDSDGVGRAFHDANLFQRFGVVAHVVEWHSSARHSNSRSILRPTRLPRPVLGMP